MRSWPRWLAAAGVLGLVTASGVAAVPGVAAAAPPLIQHEPMMPAPSRTPVNTSIDNIGWGSTNWSGYAVTGHSGAFSAVTGCWEVPTVSVTSPDSFSSTWIGIDGFNNDDLIQTGTTQASYSGSLYYFAWWEILPADSVEFGAVDPGDSVCASVTEGSGGNWTIALQDRTDGSNFSTVQAYSGSQTSAEWILERPVVCDPDCALSTLADYGQMTFDPGTVNGGNPGLTAAEGGEMLLTFPGGPIISTPSAPDGDTDGFNVAYGSAAPPPSATVSPGVGSAPGGQSVTISGGGFQSGATVAFGTSPATSVTVVSASEVTAITPSGSGTVSVTVTNPGGATATDLYGYTYVSAGAYTALQPFRICDTRTGTGTECSSDGVLGQGGTMTFQVSGIDSVPSGAQSVVLNVTAISGTAGTFLTVFPAGNAVPTASNLNVSAQTNQANLVVVPLGPGGQVSIYNSLGSINVAVDVQGYFAAASGSSVPGLFHPITPLRICDTRSGSGTACSGSALGQGLWTKVVVSGCPTGDPSCTQSVPTTDAAAVALNLTAVSGSSLTYLSVVPPSVGDACPSGTPAFSNLNVNAQTNLPTRVIVPLGPDRDVCVYNNLGSINFILDINGWFGNGSESAPGAHFYAVAPTRVCDTRSVASVGYTTECSGTSLGPGGTRIIPVAGADGFPTPGGSSPPLAVIANVTAVSGSSETYFTLYPANVSLPTASDLNVNANQNTPNLVIVQLATTGGNAGAVDLYNSLGTINAVVDVAGWFQ